MSDPALAAGIIQQAVTAAVPLAIAGYGELVAERSGVINIGIEGLMLAGCIGGFAAAALSGDAWVGLAGAVIVATALAGIFALATVWWRCDQIVAGMAVNLLAVGSSGTAWAVLQARGHDALPDGAGFDRLPIPVLVDLPVVGTACFDHYGLAYATVALGIALWWAMRRTRAGLAVRALGEEPAACAAAGIDVIRWRIGCVLAAGACAGLAGAYLALMRTHGFQGEMTAGRGFLVLALVIFARWHIGWLALGCLGFGLLETAQQHLQGLGLNDVVPYRVFKALPYVAALIALVILARSAPGPAKLGRPWPE